MTTAVYIIMTKSGVVDMRKQIPKLNSGQVAVKINLEVSDLFFDRFVPEVNVSIPDHNVIQPDIEVTIPDRVMEKILEGEDE